MQLRQKRRRAGIVRLEIAVLRCITAAVLIYLQNLRSVIMLLSLPPASSLATSARQNNNSREQSRDALLRCFASHPRLRQLSLFLSHNRMASRARRASRHGRVSPVRCVTATKRQAGPPRREIEPRTAGGRAFPASFPPFLRCLCCCGRTGANKGCPCFAETTMSTLSRFARPEEWWAPAWPCGR